MARYRREALEIELRIGAGSEVVAAKVGARVAAEAALRLVLFLAAHGVANKHAETLEEGRFRNAGEPKVLDGRRLTGLNAVTFPFPGDM